MNAQRIFPGPQNRDLRRSLRKAAREVAADGNWEGLREALDVVAGGIAPALKDQLVDHFKELAARNEL